MVEKKCFLSISTKGKTVNCRSDCAIYDEVNECCSIETITTSLLVLAKDKILEKGIIQ